MSAVRNRALFASARGGGNGGYFVQLVSRPFRLIARARLAHQPRNTAQARRIAAALAGSTAAVAIAFAVGAGPAPATTHAAPGLTYQPGYSVQNGWLCDGWTSGNTNTYRCTQHWYMDNGRYVSLNPSWVQSSGSASTSAKVDGDGDNDGDTTDSAPVSQPSAPVVHAAAPVVHTSAPAAPSNGGSVQGMIQSVFGSYAGQALRVAACESGYNPNAVNGSSGATGVFQFLYSTWVGTPYASYSRTNAWANVNAAHWVFVKDGYSWREWSCQP